MPGRDKFIKYAIPVAELREIYKDCKASCAGGKSQVRSGQDREDHLMLDNFLGLIGNYVGALWRDGDTRAYIDQRHQQNRFPTQGDGGYDLPRCRIDFKTSMMRGSADPLDYNLLVRPFERHNENVYVLLLTRPFEFENLKHIEQINVEIAGWYDDRDLGSRKPETEGIFQGAYKVPVVELYPIIPLRYERR